MVKKFAALLAVFLFISAAAFAQSKKNIIFLIADGTGPTNMSLLMQYARYAPNGPYKGKLSNLETVLNDGSFGIVFNTPVETLATDSAASGTQLSIGVTTTPGAVGVGPDGVPAETLLEKAQKLGMSTGLITDVFVIDATPVVFAAHQKSRRSYELSKEFVTTRPDVVLGGGLDYFISDTFVKDPKYSKFIKQISYASALSPKLANNEVFDKILESGYTVALNKKDMLAAKGDRLFGLFAPVYLPFNIDADGSEPTLKEMTQKALDILSKNDKGFFLMVESGAADWVAHNNDQGGVLKELLEMDETLGLIKDFIAKNPNTLLIVTADHDTGGFNFNYRKVKGQEYEEKSAAGYPLYDKTDYAAKGNLDIIAAQNKSTDKIKKEYEALSKKGLTPKETQKFIKETMAYTLPIEYFEKEKDIDNILKEINTRLGIVWGTGNHTASPVLITFYGANQGIKGGVMHSTEVNKKIADFLYGK
jgi:alkaline phosphatase